MHTEDTTPPLNTCIDCGKGIGKKSTRCRACGIRHLQAEKRSARGPHLGDRFGSLTVSGEQTLPNPDGSHRAVCVVRCDCGTEREVERQNLLRGRTTSCGCKKGESISKSKTTHGASRDRLYICWSRMKSRCENPHDKRYTRYGGRGIRIADEWPSFMEFQTWAMSHGYGPNLSIERVDIDGPYSPENCRWIPMAEQAANTSRSRNVTCFGETKHLHAWARDERCVVNASTLTYRLDHGWSPEQAITLRVG